MITMYQADDGKLFETREACETYENNKKEAKRKEEELRKQKKARLDEVRAAYKKYEELSRAYSKDYVKPYFSEAEEMLNMFF